jgi:hypothetical protein
MNLKNISNDAYAEYLVFAKSRGYQTIPKDVWLKLVWGV